MNKILRKTIFMLALCLGCSISSWAQDDFTVDGITYGTNYLGASDWLTIKDGSNYKGSFLNIPAELNHNGTYYDIVAISDGAFMNNTNLKTVVVGDNVGEIGASAFEGCTNLSNVTIIRADISFIYSNAFAGCADNLTIKLLTPNDVISGFSSSICTETSKYKILFQNQASYENFMSRGYTYKDIKYGIMDSNSLFTKNCKTDLLYTYCSSNYVFVEEYAFVYEFAGLQDGYMYGTYKSDRIMEPGKPYILVPYGEEYDSPTADVIFCNIVGSNVTKGESTNGMYACLESTKLKGSDYYYLGTKGLTCIGNTEFTMPANKCYFKMSEIPTSTSISASAKKLMPVSSLTTAVNAVESADATVNVYNMQGVKVRSNVSADNATADLEPGLYIVGGKKIIKK